MLWSMRKLLAKFPWFLNKHDDSNFYKSETVFNKRFRELYEDIFKVYESFQIEKSMWVYKVQEDSESCKLYFFANFENIKCVEILQNDEVIYTESYDFDEEKQLFMYNVEVPLENMLLTDKFVLRVETYTEYVLEKGYPENDTKQDDVYDHDPSLDTIGLFLGVPRKNYSPIPEEYVNNSTEYLNFYTNTEPPFNDRLTEDDWHYMNRMLEYARRKHTEPLPALEVWKWLGIPATVVNREELLCKMFDPACHLGQDGEYDPNWVPLSWEHKDLQCVGEGDDGVFLFVSCSTTNPVYGQSVVFRFFVLNMFGESVGGDYCIVPFCNGNVWMVDDSPVIVDGVFTVPSDDLPEEGENTFIFKLFNRIDGSCADALGWLELNNGLLVHEDDEILSDEFTIIVRGCDDADIFCDSNNGDDDNIGSFEEPVRTLEHAFELVNGEKNIILLKPGDYKLNDTIEVGYDTIILNCGDNPPVIVPSGGEAFSIRQGVTLTVINVGVSKSCCEYYTPYTEFVNDNEEVKRVMGVGLNRPIGCKTLTNITLSPVVSVDYDEYSVIDGGLFATEGYEAELLEKTEYNSTVDVYDVEYTAGEFELIGEAVAIGEYDTVVTEQAGRFNCCVKLPVGLNSVPVLFAGDDEYCKATATVTAGVYHKTYLTVADDGTISLNTTHDDLSMIINDDLDLIVDYGENMDFEYDTDEFVMEDYYDY